MESFEKRVTVDRFDADATNVLPCMCGFISEDIGSKRGPKHDHWALCQASMRPAVAEALREADREGAKRAADRVAKSYERRIRKLAHLSSEDHGSIVAPGEPHDADACVVLGGRCLFADVGDKRRALAAKEEEAP